MKITNAILSGISISLLSCASVSAAKVTNVIKVNRNVTYLNAGVAGNSVRQCGWETLLIADLVEEADGRVQITDENLANVAGRTLSIYVTSVQAFAGNNPERPNWAYISGDLKDNGKRIAHFEAKTRPAKSRYSSTCKVLKKFSQQLAEAIATWTKKPKDAQIGYVP